MSIRLYIILLLLVLSTLLKAQKCEQIPSEVKNRFTSDYVDATDIAWVVKDNIFIVSFKHQSKYKTAAYLNTGKRLYITTEASSTSIPVEVREAIRCELERVNTTDPVF
jgi:hypothetical protein